MLAEAIVQILTNAPLFPAADFQDGAFQDFTLGDIRPGGDYIADCLPRSQQNCRGPAYQPPIAAFGKPITLFFYRWRTARQLIEASLITFAIFGGQKEIPQPRAPHVGE